MEGRPFFTVEDFKISFNLFCCVYGIGTLGMPANFSRAGPYIAVVAMIFMAFANIYSSVACSKVLLMAPKSIKTFSDLGEWSMGTTGRYLALTSQMSNCLLIPCAFLVLGGTLLDDLFPGAFSDRMWIVFMALMVLPVCLTPTLKEGAGAAFAGCIGTIIADIIGVSVLLHGMAGHPSVPSPHLTFKQVPTTFGNLSLAYGAGIVIPSLQRQHSDPTRMPRVVGVTLSFISFLFLALASSGYSAVGCQIAGNLLFSIYPDPETGLSTLGFFPHWGLVVIAFLFMQLHITIAFAVIAFPAFYSLERMLLGMHKHTGDEVEALDFNCAEVPEFLGVEREPDTFFPNDSMADTENESLISSSYSSDYDKEMKEYKGVNATKYVILRITVVVILAVVAIVLKNHFLDLTDFIGASCITVSCIFLPIVFYLTKCWDAIPIYEKIPAVTVVVVCLVLGCYVTYTSGKALFFPAMASVRFPFCDPEYQTDLYFVKNETTSA